MRAFWVLEQDFTRTHLLVLSFKFRDYVFCSLFVSKPVKEQLLGPLTFAANKEQWA